MNILLWRRPGCEGFAEPAVTDMFACACIVLYTRNERTMYRTCEVVQRTLGRPILSTAGRESFGDAQPSHLSLPELAEGPYFILANLGGTNEHSFRSQS